MSKPIDRAVQVPFAGPALLGTPLLNKGTAFSEQERDALHLRGLLPQQVETIEQQAARAYQQYQACGTDLDKHILLRSIQDSNETLFYRVVDDHLDEMLPIIYTPTVGKVCQEFSRIYRSHRGLFISIADQDRIDEILNNVTKDHVKVIVVSDCERILGLGDQGVGGMGIPIGKLSLYTACGGISPAYTLPVVLDVGTNNPALLADPLYFGRREQRVRGADYDRFLQAFVEGVQRRWPEAILQFEDFALTNAMPLLARYRDQLCCFNDDIQGTAAVTVGTLLAACKVKGQRLSEQTVAFVGAGSAGCGIAEQIIAAMQLEGLSEAQARSRVYLLNSKGLLTDRQPDLYDFQQRLAHTSESLAQWDFSADWPSLQEVVSNAKPTVLIGVSGKSGLFTQQIVETMHAHCAQPIIMPLSNPTSQIEAHPKDILQWTGGQALVATGSPFLPIELAGKTYPIAQCNNSYIFPGIGLGAIASKATRITDGMLMASAQALAESAGAGQMLPPLREVQAVSKRIAFAVGMAAQRDSVAAPLSEQALSAAIEQHFWQPVYRQYVRRPE
ncbi:MULTISPECIES: NAD-dependent malic enzyme [Pseudomonas]|jgi:malate dehydrogenase (oxaloacetate-decarboxylating)|uniref:NAD-dependent malic enzyme n=1 Tax=Pseudomonas TaxID=286 RepID=UPI0009D4D20C|nr:NAD-dependent malic enzyme [Pseudomonas sp. VI4.1]OPK10920.1 NAD-dependent malic enzyme [Pseudomonas sp. VI4.1]